VTQSISALVSTSLTLKWIKNKRHLGTTLWKRKKYKRRKKSKSENAKTFEYTKRDSYNIIKKKMD
jgi:hypothetical protein